MARKKAKITDPTQADGELAGAVTLTVTEETATNYLNAVEVGQSFFEFALFFGKIPAKLTSAQVTALRETRRLELPATLQLLIPPTMVPGLIYALNVERKKYEDIHGVKLPEFPMMAQPPKSANNAH